MRLFKMQIILLVLNSLPNNSRYWFLDPIVAIVQCFQHPVTIVSSIIYNLSKLQFIIDSG